MEKFIGKIRYTTHLHCGLCNIFPNLREKHVLVLVGCSGYVRHLQRLQLTLQKSKHHLFGEQSMYKDLNHELISPGINFLCTFCLHQGLIFLYYTALATVFEVQIQCNYKKYLQLIHQLFFSCSNHKAEGKPATCPS